MNYTILGLVWLIILTIAVLVLCFYIAFIPHINVTFNIQAGNYTLDIGNATLEAMKRG